MTKLTVKDYQVYDKIGEGAMSEIYLAIGLSGEKVALKVLRTYFNDQKNYHDRLLKEASLLSLLCNDKIVQCFGTVQTDDSRLAIIQEYIDGRNLSQVLGEDNTQKYPIAGAALISEILLGLEDAHRQSIIHRDLKPENIMLTSEGRVKITDFGVAKGLLSSEQTQTGLLIGSPAYMAPELIAGSIADEQSDIYSLGVILYKMCTGQLPFSGQNYSHLAGLITDGKYLSPAKVNPKLHPELIAIINKAMSRDKNLRYKKVYEFRYDLLKFLDSLGVDIFFKVLSRFYNGDTTDEIVSDERLLSTLIVRADLLMSMGNKKESMPLIQQALKLSPRNEKVQYLLKKSSSGRYSNKTIVPIVASVLILVSILMVNNEPKEETKPEVIVAKVIETPVPIIAVKTPPVVLKKEEPKVVVKDVVKVKLSAPKIENETKPIEVVKKMTKLILKLEPDVEVYLDNINVTKEAAFPIELNPGRHFVKLQKPGFDPISSFVDVPEGETTVINAKGGM